MIRSPAWCRLHRTARSNDCERDRNHSDRLWHTGRTSVLAGQAEPGTAVRLRARRHLSLNRLTGPPVLIHLVAPLGTHLLDVEVTACRQGAQRDRRESIRTPRGRRLAAAGAVAEIPAERWHSQEGPTPKLEAVRGTNVAPLGTPAFRVGRRVRISFAPAGSLQTIGPS